MKDTCIRPFSYLVIDRLAAQESLNRMASQGWELKKIYFGLFARFRPTERTDLTYFLDYADPRFQEEPDYLRLCADAGWEQVQRTDYCTYYASRPGTRPSPIQTDPELEYQRYRSKVSRRMMIGTALVFAVLLIQAMGLILDFRLYPPGFPNQLDFIRTLFTLSNFFVVLLPLLLLEVLGGLAYWFALLRRMMIWKREAAAGIPLSCHSPRTAKLWGILRFLGNCGLYLPFLLLPVDALLNHSISLAAALGCLVGGGLSLCMYWGDPRLKRRSLSLMGFCAVVLLCFLLHTPFRAAVPLGRLPAAPVLEEAVIDESSLRRGDTLLGSMAQWDEYTGWQPDGTWPSHVTYKQCLTVKSHTFSFPALARFLFGPLPADLEPMSGLEGVWRSPSGDSGRFTYLIRRGNTQLTILGRGADDPAIPAAALAWLEQLKL